MPRFTASDSECLIFTFKAGMLAAVGHDLKLRVDRFEIEVEAGAVRARFEAASVRVVGAVRGGLDDPSALSAKDRRDIEASIGSAVLDARNHPVIAFASTKVAAEGAGYRLEGLLTIRGHERALSMFIAREGDRAVTTVQIRQPDFGIKPYSAMLGALRVKPELTIRLRTPWPPLT